MQTIVKTSESLFLSQSRRIRIRTRTRHPSEPNPQKERRRRPFLVYHQSCLLLRAPRVEVVPRLPNLTPTSPSFESARLHQDMSNLSVGDATRNNNYLPIADITTNRRGSDSFLENVHTTISKRGTFSAQANMPPPTGSASSITPSLKQMSANSDDSDGDEPLAARLQPIHQDRWFTRSNAPWVKWLISTVEVWRRHTRTTEYCQFHLQHRVVI